MSNARYAIELTIGGGQAVLGAVRGVGAAFGGIGGALATANRNVFYFSQNLVNLGRTAAGIAGKGVSMGESLIGPIADLEAAQIQFANLLGSAEKARAHIQAILDSPISSAFDDADVLAGSRTLALFGGEALGAGQNLQMVADLAAASGAKFETAAQAFGKLFDSIQSGEGAGDAARAFRPMGISLGDLDKKLDAMTEGGASAAQMWEVVTERFTRFRGVSDELAGTMGGRKNSIADSWAAIKRVVGQPLFVMVKGELSGLSDQLNTQLGSERFQVILSGAGQVLAEWVSKAKATLTGGITLDDLVKGAETGQLGSILAEQLTNVGAMVADKAMELGRQLGRAIVEGMKDAAKDGMSALGDKLFGGPSEPVTIPTYGMGSGFGGGVSRVTIPARPAPPVAPVITAPTAAPTLARLRAGDFDGQQSGTYRALDAAATRNEESARNLAAAAAALKATSQSFENMAAAVGRF